MKKVIAWTLALIAPAASWSIYLYCSRLERTFTAASDYLALGVAIGIGAIGIYMVAASRGRGLAMILVYIMVLATGLYLGREMTLCSIGECP